MLCSISIFASLYFYLPSFQRKILHILLHYDCVRASYFELTLVYIFTYKSVELQQLIF